MFSYCLKCKKVTESVDSKVSKTMVEQCYHQNVLYLVVKIKIYKTTRNKRIIEQFKFKSTIK